MSISQLCNGQSQTTIFDSQSQFSDGENESMFVVLMTGCEKNPAVSSWEETQLESLTPDTAAVQIVE